MSARCIQTSQQTVIDLFIVSLMALAILVIGAQFVDISRIHVSGLDGSLNDQVGYINVARELATTGQLQSNIIYPSTLWQHTSRNYFYLPGHYAMLAASYKLFGFGVVQSLLPNLVAFVLSAAGVFLTGAKLYSRRVGYLAAFLFIIFPANVIYALTAMSELTRVAVSVLAICLFVYLPGRWKLFIGPLLPVVPFLFKETGALLVIPIVLLTVTSKVRRPWLRMVAVGAATMLVLLVVYKSDWVSGRPDLLHTLVFDPRFTTIHTDAIAQQAVANKTLGDWIGAVPRKMIGDAGALVNVNLFRVTKDDGFEVFSIAVILAIMIASLGFGAARRDWFFIATGALIAATLLVLLALYLSAQISYLSALIGYSRWLLFTDTFGAIVLASLFERYMLSRSVPRYFQVGLLALLLGIGLYGVYKTAYLVRANDAQDDVYTACLDQLRLDAHKVLVVPYYMSEYVYLHYPVTAALIPANKETLTLLQAKYDIGTMIVPTAYGANLADTQLTTSDLQQANLTFKQLLSCNGTRFLVFQSTAGE